MNCGAIFFYSHFQPKNSPVPPLRGLALSADNRYL